MREPRSIRVTTYALLGLFVFMVAVPLFWMVTTALKTNKDLYEDFTYLPHRPTLQHFVRAKARTRWRPSSIRSPERFTFNWVTSRPRRNTLPVPPSSIQAMRASARRSRLRA